MPNGGGWEVFNTSRIKVASIDKTKKSDLGDFDLEAAVKENPHHLFVKAFAIKENEVNDNGDAFSPEELEKAAYTFVNCPVFVNHQNDDVEKARGKVVHAWYDKDAGGIFVIEMVDKEAYPQLARGIEEKYIQGTSMGAQVEYSCCSICHNKAATKDEFCSHIRERKNKKYSGTHKCEYHKSKPKPSNDCPVHSPKCACKAGETIEHSYKDAQIHEWNYGIKFIENSFVVNPACHDCGICDILNVAEVESKIASSVEKLRKLAVEMDSAIVSGKMEKTAGMKEVNALNDAMNLLEAVARSMMAQKQMVSMEYVSDLVEQLSKLQETTDELIQMGYSQLPSPQQVEAMFGSHAAASPITAGAEQTSPNAMSGMQQPQQMSQSAPMQSGNVQTSPAGNGVATVTRPTFSSFEKDFLKLAENIVDNVDKIQSGMRLMEDMSSRINRSSSVYNISDSYAASSGDDKIIVAKTEKGDIHVAEFRGSTLVRLSASTEFDSDMQKLLAEQPNEAAKKILSIRSVSKESSATMANEKIAAGQGVAPEQVEVITQKQLDAKLPLHPRTSEVYETITEGKEQLAGKERSNDTTSESPQVRRGTYDTITEEQLASIKDAHITRWNDFPEVITEKQWDEMSRSVDGVLTEDYTDQITQSQMISLRKDHRWEPTEVTTQGQLADQGGTMPYAKDSARWKAASTDVNALIKAAALAITDAIANYGLSPRDITSAVSTMTATPQAQMKAAYLSLINALPHKKANRVDEIARRRYFQSKSAAASASVKPVDALLAAMSDNIGYLKAENFVDAVRRFAANKIAFAKAEADAMDKIASGNSSEDVVDIDSQFNQAFSTFGMHKVLGSIKDDLNVSADSDEFVAKAFAFAKSKVNGKTILASVDIDSDNGTFEVVLKDVAVSSKEDLEAFASAEKDGFKTAGRGDVSRFGDKKAPPFGKKEDKKEEKEACKCEGCSKGKPCTASRTASRTDMVKTAQMMGGQMPSGLGDGGGQGASLPPAPGGMGGQGGPGVQSFGQEPGAEDPMGGDDMDGDLTALPPGSICPVCASEDVELVGGKGKCNNCSSEFVFKVSIEVTKWSGLTGDEEGEAGGGLDAEGEGEGFALPGGEAGPGGEGGGMEESLPVAASTLLKPEALKKMASAKIQLGSVSPYVGGTRTTYLGLTEDGANEFLCQASGHKYVVRTAQKEDHLFAQWEWVDHFVEPCKSCRRNKKAFIDGLTSVGHNEKDFDHMVRENRKAAGLVVLKMAKSGALNTIKTASKNGSVLEDYKKVLAFVPADKFPTETCREVISRAYGEDAICLSGPDEGKNLADSICKRLTKANIYSDQIAVKLAEQWSDRDGCVNCLEDYIRANFSADTSAMICQSIKKKYAQSVDMLADDLSDPSMGDGLGDTAIDGTADVSGDPMFTDETSMDGAVDPFAPGAEQQGFVTVEIPMDVLEKLDAAFDQALGIDPSTEEHHDPGALPGGTAEIAVPQQAVEQIEQAVDPALDAAVGAEDALQSGEHAVEDAVQDVGEAMEAPAEESSDSSSPADDSTIFEEEKVDDSGSEKSEDKKEDHDDSSEKKDEKKDEGNPFAEASAKNAREKKESSNSSSNKVVTSSNFSESNKMSEFKPMQRGTITGTGKVSNLDLSGVLAVLKKQAGESGLTQKNVQDDEGTKPHGGDGGSAMGHEEGFKAAEPEVPHKGSGATMGQEPKELMPTDNTKIPAGGGEMGHEKEQGYTAEKGHEFTGGRDGAGSSKAASSSHKPSYTKNMTDDLASRLLRIASDKKVNAPAPVAEDKDIGKISDNKDHPDTPESMKRTPHEESDKVQVPEKGFGAFMGHEEESIGSVPKSPEAEPSIPAGGGKNEKFDKNEKNTPEKQENIKGTVIAGGNEESLASKRAAEKLAGKMIERGMITAEQISSKIAELSRYQVEQIADYEKALFGAIAKKGLDAVAGGVSTPLVINASKNIRQDPAVELKNKLQSHFKLDKQNRFADGDPNITLSVFNK